MIFERLASLCLPSLHSTCCLEAPSSCSYCTTNPVSRQTPTASDPLSRFRSARKEARTEAVGQTGPAGNSDPLARTDTPRYKDPLALSERASHSSIACPQSPSVQLGRLVSHVPYLDASPPRQDFRGSWGFLAPSPPSVISHV
jgi:hypothetical protein